MDGESVQEWGCRHFLEEAEESEEEEEAEEPEEDEVDMKGSEDEKDCVEPLEPLVHNREGAAVEDREESEGVVVI